MEKKKMFNVKLPKDLWVFLKKHAAQTETTMAGIIVELLTQYKKQLGKKN